ncbi:F-box/RNI superfamily protein [Medicago truncatula]|uniref:F-box/RNI superfamily protein n=1 Tax=Medicago truncatula TaxID=3880 RepID=G7K262_MEDTR|nr:F-box/RNI superfamily protein [Medicago truncatula]
MKKKDEKRRRRRAADRISSLPDDVLCHILSFVSTQEAVATSVLSKRWTHLWRSIDNIDFKYIEIDSIKSYSKFNNSINSVLISRDAIGGGSHSINRFSLDIEYRLKYLCLRLHVEFVDPIYPGNDDDDGEDEDEDEEDDDDYNDNDDADVDNNDVDNNVVVNVDHRITINCPLASSRVKPLLVSTSIGSLSKIEILSCFYLDVQFPRI